MFILYSVVLGLAIGFALGGRLDGLAEIHLRAGWIIAAALVVQIVIFSPAGDAIAGIAPAVYVASTAAVLVALVVNRSVPGLAIVAVGAASNLVAIVANSGYMPAGAGALAALGRPEGQGYSNSVVLANPAPGPLTDVYALPSWLPLANLFSVGDALIALGIVVTIALAMRRTRGGGAADG
jgi:Family of unknown function (DUF5317)